MKRTIDTKKVLKSATDLTSAITLSEVRFSHKQEPEANNYGFELCIKHGFNPCTTANALEKLNNLSKGQKSSMFPKMFSSHPDGEKRVSRVREKADAHVKKISGIFTFTLQLKDIQYFYTC
ncbi:M48 family metalloprotease [Gabonibacter chumensis]|uniref:M48 family metalloprotease n=1 Tax=Gabonibacter chumensis TaxID=2972474 RepID=UPI0025734D01|nr:M48 family metalloprotease [Gabonibacter chumensis]MCR9010928.1 M48 family metalloprotease [Gabonibacter chumensis]